MLVAKGLPYLTSSPLPLHVGSRARQVLAAPGQGQSMLCLEGCIKNLGHIHVYGCASKDLDSNCLASTPEGMGSWGPAASRQNIRSFMRSRHGDISYVSRIQVLYVCVCTCLHIFMSSLLKPVRP